MRWAVGAAALLAGAAAAAAILLLDSGNADEPPGAGGRVIAVEARVEPRRHLFADTIGARVDVVVDRSRVDPAAVGLRVGFEPFEPIAAPGSERTDTGGLTRLRFTVSLRCLGDGCLPLATGEPFTPASGAALVDGAPAAEVEWPDVALGSRLPRGASSGSRAEATAFPPPSYRIAPGVAVASLAGLAGGLVVGAAALLAIALRRRTAPGPGPAPLARALLLLAAARREAAPEEERKALDLLAVELAKRGEGDLARLASELAWGRPLPEAESTDTLAERIAGLAEGNGRRA